MSVLINPKINPDTIFKLGRPRKYDSFSHDFKESAYNALCSHIAKGNSKETFVYLNDEGIACYKTLLKCFEDEEKFPTAQKFVADAIGRGVWEGIIQDSARGENTKANVASLQMLMRNKYGWDRKDENRRDAEPEILSSYERLMNQLTMRQKQFPEIEEAEVVSSFNLSAAAAESTPEASPHPHTALPPVPQA